MNGKTEKLKGRGRLVGRGIDTDTSYEILVNTPTRNMGHLGDRSPVIDGLTTITGRVELPSSIYPPLGEKLTLTLEGGRKLLVIMQTHDTVIATGGLF
jgi:hypothetical protein